MNSSEIILIVKELHERQVMADISHSKACYYSTFKQSSMCFINSLVRKRLIKAKMNASIFQISI